MAQKLHNSIAVVGVMRMGEGNKWMIDPCTHTKGKEYLVLAKCACVCGGRRTDDCWGMNRAMSRP